MFKLFGKAEGRCPEGSGKKTYSTDVLNKLVKDKEVSSHARGIQILCDIDDDLDGGKRKSKKFRKHKYKGKSYKRTKRTKRSKKSKKSKKKYLKKMNKRN